jgi:hypothetical protein
MATKKSLFQQAKALTVADRPFSPLQLTKTIMVNLAELDKFAAIAEKQFPDAVLHEKAIVGGGRMPNGEACVPYALRQKTPNGVLTVYSSGKAVLIGAFATLDLTPAEE